MVWWTANYGIKLHIVLYNVSVSWNILWFIVFFVLDVLWLWLQIILGIHLHLVYPFFPVTTVHCFPLVSDWFDWWYTLIDLIEHADAHALVWIGCMNFLVGHPFHWRFIIHDNRYLTIFLCPCTSFITKQDEINTET